MKPPGAQRAGASIPDALTVLGLDGNSGEHRGGAGNDTIDRHPVAGSNRRENLGREMWREVHFQAVGQNQAVGVAVGILALRSSIFKLNYLYN